MLACCLRGHPGNGTIQDCWSVSSKYNSYSNAFLKRINLHLEICSCIIHVEHQFSVEFKSFCGASWSCWLRIQRWSTQSSAKRRMVDVTPEGRSLINTRKSRGPSTEPWGTAEMTLVVKEQWLPMTVHWDLFVKKQCIHDNMNGLSLRQDNLNMSRWWGTRSNALEKQR